MVPYRSLYKTVKYSVLQGSFLGPILFILEINDLPKITIFKFYLYADDISIILTNNSSQIQSDYNRTMKSVIQRLTSNSLVCVCRFIKIYIKRLTYTFKIIILHLQI